MHNGLTYLYGKWARAVHLSDHILNSADFAGFQPDFDSMRMLWRFCQYLFDHAARPLAGALILLQDDFNAETGFNVFPVLTVHSYGNSSHPIRFGFMQGTESGINCLYYG